MTVCDQPRKLHHTTWYTVHRTESARSLFHNYTIIIIIIKTLFYEGNT